jgi:hypothetical protein
MRLYDIWVSAVLHLYPHHRVELASYRELIVNMFRVTLSPLPAIKYDWDSWERYSCQPYHLNSSKDVLSFPLLSQLLSFASTPSSTGSKRKSSNSQEGQRKHSEMICQNWNLGGCDGDTCGYGRKHNQCRSVMSITELKTNKNVLQPSISDANNNERLQLIAAGHKAQQVALAN